MLQLGMRCPRCEAGTIVLVSRYRRAPDEEYSDEELRGPVGRAQTRYRCSKGCTWVVKDDSLKAGAGPHLTNCEV